MDNSDRAINGRRDAQTKRFHKEDVYFPGRDENIVVDKTNLPKKDQKEKNDSLMGAHSLRHRCIGCMT